ncbi:hypothetical protein PENSPDRAFT_750490 [Peniophora sp. CONT]|nr:hypothetical protein PENSPDRAFT_750490 [Peniophora sp. CONT]
MECDQVTETSGNHVSPIERLPPEIFQTILSKIGEDFECSFVDCMSVDDIARLPYTHITDMLLVSKYWYQMSSSVTELWTCLPSHAPSDAIDAFSRRSGERPVYLFIDSSFDQWTPPFAGKQTELLLMLPRVKGFLWQQGYGYNEDGDDEDGDDEDGDDEDGDDEDGDDEEVDDEGPAIGLSIADIYTILSTVEAPLLEELHVENRRPDEILRLPTLFMGTPPPKLRVLRLQSLSIDAANPLLQCPLTRLSLLNVCDIWSDGSDMVNTLLRLPYLETLEVTGLYLFALEQRISAITPGNKHPVALLPHLSSLEVSDWVTCVAVMLSHVSFPPACLIHIHAIGEDGAGELSKIRTLEALINSLNSHYEPVTASGISFRAAHALLRDPRSDYFAIEASHLCELEDSPFFPGRTDITDPDLVLGKVTKNTQLTLSVTWELPDIPTVSTARIVFAELEVLRGLEGLSMGMPGSRRGPQQPLPDFFVHFPRFDAIIAQQRHIRWLEMTHYPACAFARMAEHLAILYPELEMICIKNAALTPVPASDRAVETLDVTQLEKYLTAQARSGGLRRFHVLKCIINDTILVERLRKAVGEERWGWDGKRLGWS